MMRQPELIQLQTELHIQTALILMVFIMPKQSWRILQDLHQHQINTMN